MALLGFDDRLMRYQPIGGNAVIGIRKVETGLLGVGRFSRVAVRIPCSGNNRIQFISQGNECRIMKTATKSVFEFLAGELDGWHSLADVWFGYALSILIGLINRSQRLLARPVPGDFTADHKISTRLAPRRKDEDQHLRAVQDH
jgi:hypothetical protein